MKVQVYWNLHKKCWSVVAREGERKGRVVSHADKVRIEDAAFVVQPAGNARVKAEGVKNVHAFVRGTWVPHSPPRPCERHFVDYSPRKHETFIFRETGEPIFSAKTVVMGGPRNVQAEV